MTDEIDNTVVTGLGPRSVERPADAGSTLVAGLDGQAPVRVDGGGLITPHGASWSLDWWVGADDRWHLPAREASVRQRRVGHGPIIETSLRVPSGDVLHTVYPVVVPGGTATVIEIRNESPVPVALALTIRPYPLEGAGLQASDRGDAGRWPAVDLAPEAVTVDGVPAVVLPRSPNEAAASADVDLLQAVQQGQSLQWDGPVSGQGANAVCLYPLPHRTSLRFAVVGSGHGGFTIDGLPDAEAAARGWTAVVDRASRYEFPDSGITGLAGAARARLLLAANDLPEAVIAGHAGAGLILEGLAIGGHRLECGQVVEAFARSFPTEVVSATTGGDLARAIGLATELIGDDELTEAVLEPLAQLTHLVERAAGRKPDEGAALGRNNARSGLARVADLAGQHRAAIDLRSGLGQKSAIDLATVSALGERAAPAKRWADETSADDDRRDEHKRPLLEGSDSALSAARFWLAARQLLVREARSPAGEQTIELLPDFPTAWRGGSVEIHEAPVAGTLVSFAIRWHGYRPALLWEITQTGVSVPLHVTCPGLDPMWHTTDATGEALLEGQADELPAAPAPGDSFN